MDDVIEDVRNKMCKGLMVSEDELINLIERYCEDSDIPDDCEILAVNYDFSRRFFVARIRSDSFDVVADCSELELMRIGKLKEQEDD